MRLGPRPSGRPDAGPSCSAVSGSRGATPAGDDPWAPFGPASLVLPTFTVVAGRLDATLTVAIAPDRPSDPDPDEVDDVGPSCGTRPSPATAAPPDRDAGAAPTRRRATRPRRPGSGPSGCSPAPSVAAGSTRSSWPGGSTFEAAADLDVVGALRHLAATAPESTTFAFTRGGTTFLGATPERLARTVGRSFETVAIAGSAPRGADPDEDARFAAGLLASEKDREEHAVVVDTLRAGLAPIVETLTVAERPGSCRSATSSTS